MTRPVHSCDTCNSVTGAECTHRGCAGRPECDKWEPAHGAVWIVGEVAYTFDTSGDDGGNECKNCAANLDTLGGRALCDSFPGCPGGVWREARP